MKFFGVRIGGKKKNKGSATESSTASSSDSDSSWRGSSPSGSVASMSVDSVSSSSSSPSKLPDMSGFYGREFVLPVTQMLQDPKVTYVRKPLQVGHPDVFNPKTGKVATLQEFSYMALNCHAFSDKAKQDRTELAVSWNKKLEYIKTNIKQGADLQPVSYTHLTLPTKA